MTLIKREDAIDAICKEWCYVTYGNCPHVDDGFVCDGCDDVKALNALPSAEAKTIKAYAESVCDNEDASKLCEDADIGGDTE